MSISIDEAVSPRDPWSVDLPGLAAERELSAVRYAQGHDTCDALRSAFIAQHLAEDAVAATAIDRRFGVGRPDLSPAESLRALRHGLSALRARERELREYGAVERQVRAERLGL